MFKQLKNSPVQARLGLFFGVIAAIMVVLTPPASYFLQQRTVASVQKKEAQHQKKQKEDKEHKSASTSFLNAYDGVLTAFQWQVFHVQPVFQTFTASTQKLQPFHIDEVEPIIPYFENLFSRIITPNAP